MVRTGTQLYTLRNVEGSFEDLLEAVADAGFEGVEFAYRVTDEDPQTVRETLDRTGLSVAGAHVHIDALEDDFEETFEFYEALGCEDFVVPWLDEEVFTSTERVERAAERLDAIADELTGHDARLHYHNHDHEFVELEDGTGFDALVEATDIGIELDVGLALLAGADPVALLDELGDRISLVHLKDVDIELGGSVPLGQGDLDVERCAATVRDNGGEWLLYEYEGEDPLEAQASAATIMRDLD